ncbi:hypothetical protein [Vibrio sp. Hal054]|uniref:hypothetical protein n=1 Tax=Vibrio sp. Hal054 TaxID=3035158 RepID=UPI00301C790E
MSYIERLLNDGWIKYPQTRPCKGAEVEVAVFDLDYSLIQIGKGVSTVRKKCGVCISINGVIIDSDRSVLWRYVKDKVTTQTNPR